MNISKFLTRISDDGNYSGHVNVPFLLLAHERGIIGEEELARAAVLSEEQQDCFYQISNEVLVSLRINAGVGPEHAEFRRRISESRIDDGSRENLEENRLKAQESLRLLEKGFPGVARDYGRWLTEISRLEKRAFNTPTRQYAAGQYRLFHETSMWEEMEIQTLAERRMWNRVGISVLTEVQGSDALWLKSAMDFIDGIGDANADMGRPSQRFRFDAIAFQTAVLSAAVTWSLAELSTAYRLTEVGEKTVVEVDGLKTPVVVSTPEFASVDIAVRIHEGHHIGGGFVTLPPGPVQLGEKRWKKLMESPLFSAHPTRLIPSDDIWGIRFPAMIPSDPPSFLDRHLEGLRTPEQHLWAQVKDMDSLQRYGITVVNQFKTKNEGYNPNAALHLVIANGEIESAKYEIFGLKDNRSLIVEVDEARISNLVAHALKYKKSPSPKQTADPAKGSEGGRKKRFGGISKSGRARRKSSSKKSGLSVSGEDQRKVIPLQPAYAAPVIAASTNAVLKATR